MCFQRDALGLDIPETVPHVACAVVVDASGPHARSIAEHSTNSIKRTNKLLASNDVARRRVEFAVIEAAGNVGFLSCFSPLRRHLRVTVRSGGSSCVEEGMSLAHVAIHELMADWESKCYVCRRPVIFVVSDAEFCKDDDESGDDGKFYCESGLLCPYMVSVDTKVRPACAFEDMRIVVRDATEIDKAFEWLSGFLVRAVEGWSEADPLKNLPEDPLCFFARRGDVQ